MSNLQRFYSRFIDLLHQLTPQDNVRQQIRIPKLSDKQLIALSLPQKPPALTLNSTYSRNCQHK